MSELYHHGIQGQKWGVRRYQNEDGTYTNAGLKRKAKEDYETARIKYANASDAVYKYHKETRRNGNFNSRKSTNLDAKEYSARTELHKARYDYESAKAGGKATRKLKKAARTAAYDEAFDKYYDRYKNADADKAHEYATKKADDAVNKIVYDANKGNVGKIVLKAKAKTAMTDLLGGAAVVGATAALLATGHDKSAAAMLTFGAYGIGIAHVENKAKAGREIYEKFAKK